MGNLCPGPDLREKKAAAGGPTQVTAAQAKDPALLNDLVVNGATNTSVEECSKLDHGTFKQKALRSYSSKELAQRGEFEVKVVDLPPKTVLVCSTNTDMHSKDHDILRLLEKCAKHLSLSQGHMAGNPFACLHSHSDDDEHFVLDVGFPVSGAVHGNDADIFLADFPESQVAEIAYVGKNTGDALAPVYSYLKQYVLLRLGQVDRPRDPWEEYDSPDECVSDSPQTLTIIRMALK